jgi:DNA-directed RNA polymerase specialized sigma24 family protein
MNAQPCVCSSSQQIKETLEDEQILDSPIERALGGLPKDEREAVLLYKLAADQGNAAAHSSLARVNGVPPAPK